MTCRRILLLLAVVALSACGGSAPTIAPTITSFQATPATVLAGGTTTLSWTVPGDAPITLELTPDVGDVSGSNDVQVSPDTTTTYTLTATNDVGSDSASLIVTVQPVVELGGTVIGLNGLPARGIEVAVHGAGGPVQTSGTDGSFDFGTVPVPYDVTIHDAAAQHSVTYLGLTLAHPTLLMVGSVTGPQHQTAVHGQVTGGFGYPAPANGKTQVAFGSRETSVRRSVPPATGTFEFPSLAWFGPLQTEGGLHALQWYVDPAQPLGPPTSYSGYARRSLTLSSTVPSHAGQDLAILPVSEGSLSGVTRVPANYTWAIRWLSIQFESGAAMELGIEGITTESFSFVTPRVSDGAPTILAFATGPQDTGGMVVAPGLPDTQSGIDLQLPVAPTLSEPSDGAVGVGPATMFRWSSSVPRVHVVRFQDGASGRVYDVLTDRTEVTLPELDLLGIAFAGGAMHDWRVYGLEPYPTVDAVADSGDAFLSAWLESPFFHPVRRAKQSVSTSWEFTLAP
jgi:hypothetical protein